MKSQMNADGGLFGKKSGKEKLLFIAFCFFWKKEAGSYE